MRERHTEGEGERKRTFLNACDSWPGEGQRRPGAPSQACCLTAAPAGKWMESGGTTGSQN